MTTTTVTTASRASVRTALVLAVVGLVALVGGGILMALGGPAGADPVQGNNGDLKVTAQSAEAPTNPHQEPHIDSCDLTVWFYGFDEGDQVTGLTFVPWEPTAGVDEDGVTYTVQWSGATTMVMGAQSGPLRLNGSLDGTLTWTGRPHPAQGYNVKVSADHTDGAKTKVFWVRCGPVEPTPTPTVTPSESPTVTPSVTPSESPTVTPSVTPSESPTVTPSVNPTVTEKPTATPPATSTGTPEETASVEPSVEPSVKPTVTESPDATGTPGGEQSEPPETATPVPLPDDEGPVPTEIHAGLGSWSTTEVWGAGLIGGGVGLLLAAASVLVGARRLETA